MTQKDFYITSNQTNFWTPILPVKRIEIFSSEEWEEFIEEWLDIKKDEYISIERVWWANDMWRDVIAYINKENWNYTWDCYQCKHYYHPLMPSDIYVEIWKILYYSFKKEYTIPNNYYFIAPKNIWTSLSKLLSNPIKFKEELIKNWDKHCKENITKKEIIEISIWSDFRKYVEDFDFKIFHKVLTKNIIEEHKNHSNHITRFWWWLASRPRLGEVPDISPIEINYINKLFEVYWDETNSQIYNDRDLSWDLLEHFKNARKCFHLSEQLKNFYRDSLPPWTFDDFQDEIYMWINGIKEKTWYETVKKTELESTKIVISSNPLKDVAITHDKIWICHQLSNNNKILWK